MLHGRTLQELATEIERQNEVKRDYLVDTQELQMRVNADGVAELAFADRELGMNDIIHGQLAEKLAIPARYYERMREEQPQLLASNVNTWFTANPARRMVRTLDNTARAYLSDSYRRIDNYEIAQAVLPLIAEMAGAQVMSCELTERKMYLKVVNPRIETEISKGDVVQSGLIISNSETGHGSVSVMPLIYRLVCSNGMIARDQGTRKFHIGRVNESDENYEIYSSDTVQQDDKAFILKLRDTVHAAVEQSRFNAIVDKMRDGKQLAITGEIPAVVELAGKSLGFTEVENKNILDHLIRGGDLSLFGMSSAVTRAAQDVTNYDRSTEMEAVGWQVLNVEPQTWRMWNAA